MVFSATMANALSASILNREKSYTLTTFLTALNSII